MASKNSGGASLIPPRLQKLETKPGAKMPAFGKKKKAGKKAKKGAY